MRYYFSPLEGLTDRIYRRLHHKYFPGITQYYTPFFSPTVHHSLTPKEQQELPPAQELTYPLVPQILTKNADDFLWIAQHCNDLGYEEVNLNVGCPSGTVTAKGKGAGLLRDPDELDCLLYGIFSKTTVPVSVKTRIGFSSPEEFPRLLEIFNRYPIKELIVHPRVRDVFYKGSTDMDTFLYATQNSNAPVCYNGNICSLEDAQRFADLGAVMLGRGLIADPGMLTPGGTTAVTLEQFYGELLEEYLVAFGGSRNAMFRLKENWRYLICRFDGGDRLYKKLRKTTDLNEYKHLTHEIFATLPLGEALAADW